MNEQSRNNAGSDNLVDLVVAPERANVLRELANSLPDITLDEQQSCDLELLATGALSPLNGFMVRSDYESVLDRMQLQNGTLWPLPVCLAVPALKAQPLEAGQSVALRDAEGFLLAVLHIEDLWPIDYDREAEKLYGPASQRRPGLDRQHHGAGGVYLGGKLEVVSLPLHFDYQGLRSTPRETKASCDKLGWTRTLGFLTRSPIHRPDFEMTLKAMRLARANLLLLPIVGVAYPKEFDYYTRVRCYTKVVPRFPPDACRISLLPLADRLAGPRSALLQAIIARNYGCTHFVLGDTSGPAEAPEAGRSSEAREMAQSAIVQRQQELGIEVIALKDILYLPFEDEYRFADQVPEGAQTVSLSGLDIRERIRAGKRVPGWAAFPEVIEELQKSYPPPRQQGFTVFLTGLSGAGKSTIAKILYCRFRELGDRPVTLLDGDIVRQHLSSELSFSREHRDINVRRIGFVATEITKNRGVAICAPIAPYAETRKSIRTSIEAVGRFVEVHVSTPLEECKRRDRKGMYAKAQAGLIKGFTGVDDPYEAPEEPELRIDTTERDPNECAKEILLFLGEARLI